MKSPCAGLLQSPLTDSNRRPPPYHATCRQTVATGSKGFRAHAAFGPSELEAFAIFCPRVFPRPFQLDDAAGIVTPAPNALRTCPQNLAPGRVFEQADHEVFRSRRNRQV